MLRLFYDSTHKTTKNIENLNKQSTELQSVDIQEKS